MVPGGFWLVENSFGWFAVLVVTIVTQLFAFCLTVLFVLVRLVPALIENFFGSMITLFFKISYFVVTFCRFLLVSRFGESFFLDDGFLPSSR